jgi:DNA-binding beta-propeller fold protein YncE
LKQSFGRLPRSHFVAVAAALLIYQTAVATDEHNGALLQLQQKIPLPGVEGRIDHLAFDDAGERLFVCALGNNTVEVVDLREGKRVHTISGLGAPQGAAFVSGRLFVANDNGGLCDIYDGKDFQLLGKVDLKDDADNVRYDPVTTRVYVGFGSGGIAILNATDGKQIGSIKLAAHPEAFEVEKQGHRIFVNVPGARHVAVVDREKGEVVTTWAPGAFGNFPMALDEADHRLFVGYRVPPKLIVLDTQTGKAVASVSIAGDPDEVFYDSKRHRIYAICGAGKIEIIEQSDANHYKTVGASDTVNGARTGLLVPQWDTMFVAVPRHGSEAAEIRSYQIK